MGSIAGAGAGEIVNTFGSQAYLDKNAGNGKTVRASGVTIQDKGGADVSANYNITYVDNTSIILKKKLPTECINTVDMKGEKPNTLVKTCSE